MKKFTIFFLKSILLILISALTNIQPSFSQITATQMGMLDFQVNQSLTANDMNGTNDVTPKLQAAVNAARDANKTLFIPSGTYKVSNTISCVMNGNSFPISIVGSSKNRPTIVLVNNATGFSDTIPKCVFILSNPSHPTPDWIMAGGIRSINVDLGTGNTNAVAFDWGCAQYVFIEDISVEARSGFAGFIGIGGASQLLANVSVNGGQYGLYLPNLAEATDWGLSGEICQSSITGCTFTNQSVNALHLWGYGGITMSGITISQSSGVAIQTVYQSYAKVIQFPFSLIDSKITFTTPDTTNVAISNTTHMNMALTGVYVTGAGKVVDNAGDENLASITPITSWTHVARFNYVDKQARNDYRGANYTGVNYNAIDGSSSNVAIVQTDATAPPADLTSKHIWAFTPSFEDADAVLVPAGSTAAQIQAAIDANTKVFLAKGTYNLSTPITLRANSIFCGCPGNGFCGSVLVNSFTPTTATWLITTDDNAAATTYMMDISTNTTIIDYMGSVNWRAGANSIFRSNVLDFNYNYSTEPNMVRLNFSGNGGGRIFNYQDERAPDGTLSPNFRKVRVTGTSQQLTFYGLNLERGGGQYPVSSTPMLELTNASKVRVFGAKTEAFQPYATISGCNDIFITNVCDYCAVGYGTTGADQIVISGTNDKIELSNMMWIAPPAASWKIIKDPWNTNTPSRKANHVGVYHYNWSTIADVTAPVNVAVTGVSVSPATASLATGGTSQLTATVLPATATNQAVTWSSSNAAVATVSTSGLVTGVSAGTATVTVTTTDGGFTSTCLVSVTSVAKFTGTIIGTTGSYNNDPNVTKENAMDGLLTTYYDAAAATGQWVGLDLGTAKTLTIVKYAPRATWSARMNGGKFQGSNVADFSTATDLYTISGNPVEGSLTTVSITNSTQFRYVRYLSPTNGWGNIAEVEFWGSSVSIPVTGISVSPAIASITTGSTSQLTATVAPANATNQTVTWSSNNTAVATVSASGLVTAVAAGLATVTVTTADGAFTATCAVTVSNIAVAGVSVSPATASLATGGTNQLTATVLPANATNKAVTWSSSNTAVATVSASGLVTAVTAGTATVTVTTTDGGFMANSVITVANTPTNIALNKTATASSFETGNTVANGNDGSTATRWCSVDGTLNQWWKVDLGVISSVIGTEITWEHSTVAYKYKIEVSSDNVAWTLAVDKTANTTIGQVMSDNFTASARYVRITVTGLPAGIWTSFYEFKVWGTSSTDTQAPTVPVGLASSAITSTSFTLSWTASTDNVAVTGYDVYKAGVLYGSTASTSISVTGLTASTAYSMTVKAKDAAGNLSAASTALNVTTSAGADTQAPTVPAGLASSAITSTSFTLSWTASTDNVAVTGYDVYKAGVLYGSTASTSISVTGLTASTAYSMTVKAKDAAGNVSAASTALNVTTSAGTTLTNIALNKIATASSVETGNTVVMGNDGSTSTRWCSVDGTLNQWWKVDLGVTSSITGTQIMWEHNNVAYKYKIEVSTDNTTWTVVVDKTANTAVGQIMDDIFTSSARYVRITVTGLPSGIWTSFYEFRVWGTVVKSARIGDKAILALENKKTNSLKVYPNPVSDILTIELSVVNDNEKGQIFDIAGMLVKEFDITHVKTNLDVDELQNGVYFLRFVKNSAMSAKFIKQ